MTQAQFPWRPLGALLVERDLLTSAELEDALSEQQRSGRLLGQILVDRDYLSGFSLTRALSDQHGVELRSKARPPEIGAGVGGPWRPLGRLLVEKRLLTGDELESALAEQRERRGRLGEILVARGYVTGLTLARALAEQHGLDPTPMAELEAEVETAIRRDEPGEPLYRVRHIGSVLYESPSFLDAADFASELVQRREADVLEIQRTRAGAAETVWTYSSAAAAVAGPSLVETFGFDPTRWR
jgi:hypothetical protein